MSVLWQKVWFELWRNKARTLWGVLSIAASVGTIGTIFGMTDQMLTGMDAAHQSVVPSHISFRLNGFITRDDAQALRSIAGVADVEPFNQISIRYKLRPEDDWQQGSLVIRDDYTRQLSDLVQLKQGDWPSGDRVGVERLTGESLKIGIGDRVSIRYDNAEGEFSIGGVIRHPFVPPPAFGGPAYFFADVEQLEGLGIPSGTFLRFSVRVTPYSDDHARAVVSDIKAQLAEWGVGVAETIYQDPAKHWGRMYVEGIVLVMQLLAGVSVFVSVVLISNTLATLVARQTNQIGVIKLIGGRSTTIIKVYLSAALAYGLLALLIALPLGVFLAFGMAQGFLTLFNIDYTTFQVSTQAVVLQVLTALGTPILAVLVSVLGAAAMPARQALIGYGLGGDFKPNRIDRAVERVAAALFPPHYAAALGNIFRRKGRLILIQLVLVSAGTMFLLIMTLSTSLGATLDGAFQRRNFDVSVVFREPQRLERITAVASSIKDIEAAELWPTYPVMIWRDGRYLPEMGTGVNLAGIPIDSDFYREVIIAGRWLDAGDGRAIVLNREAADKNNIQLGDQVTLDIVGAGKSDWQVVGLYQVVYRNNFSPDVIFAPQSAVFQAIGQADLGDQLYVRTRLHEESLVNSVSAQLRDQFEAGDMKVFYSQTEFEVRQQATGQFGIVISMLLALALTIAVAGGVGLMGILSVSVIERAREIGVLRSIGARSRAIRGMLIIEGVLQGALSWGLSVTVSLLLARSVVGAMGSAIFKVDLSYQYSWAAVGMWLVIALMVATLASILPARNATRVIAHDSLRYA